MRPNAIVVVLPCSDHDLCLPQAVENLALQTLVLKLAVEALAVPILPRTAGLDVQRLGSKLRQLSTGVEFSAVVGPQFSLADG